MRVLHVAFAALLATTLGDQLALAQPAAALGQPLPDANLEGGTVAVRVIAGNASSPVVGTDVTLIVGSAQRTARTNAEGRAMFPGLTAGASVQAKIKDSEGKDITSTTFQVPSSGGVRLMLSTKPFGGGSSMGHSNPGGPGGGPAGGGAGGMPGAKAMSGQPRQDRETPAGTYIVRLTYDNLVVSDGKMVDSQPPVGETVTLVGYVADDGVAVIRAKTDAQGHAKFTGLDVSGSTAYFALAQLPRGTGVDRMFAIPAQLDATVGVRAVLSGEKRDSQLPNADTHTTQHSIRTPPGKVRVTLEGIPSPGTKVRLVDAESQRVVAEAVAGVMQADPSTLQGSSSYEAKTDVPASTLDVVVTGGAGTNLPLGDVEIRIVAHDAKAPDGPVTKTGADGTARVTAPASTDKQRAVFSVLGKDFVSEPFDLSKSGGKLTVRAQWSNQGRPQALFDVAPTAGQVLYAEATTPAGARLEGTFRSMPFAPIAQTGTHVGIIIYPRVMIRFNMRAMVEDQLLAVQGKWTVENNSWIPYRASDDGMTIPLPKNHKGGVVAEMNQNDVAVVPQEGFRILRPLPAGGGMSFVGGFTMSVGSGDVEWTLDLPHGTFGSDIHIRESPGMTVELPKNVKGSVKPGKDGHPYFMIEQISIHREKSMAMTIHGLPTPPAWRIWAPRFVGLLVLATIIAGIAFAMFGKRGPGADAASRRAALLDELVFLERSNQNPKRKEQVMAELEKLWNP